MSYEVVLIGLDEDLNEMEEVYTRCESHEEAERAALQLRRSWLPFVIQIREYENPPDSEQDESA